MKIGYARVSTNEQSLDRQLDKLWSEGCERIFQEKVSGAKASRPELSRLFDILREGDLVIVTELSRLNRSVKDLFALTERIHAAGADLRSLKESWADTTTPQGKLIFAIFAGVAEFERDLIRQRTNEGLSAARARGRHGGRPAVDENRIHLAIKMYQSKSCTLSEITKATGVCKATLYKYLKKGKK